MSNTDTELEQRIHRILLDGWTDKTSATVAQEITTFIARRDTEKREALLKAVGEAMQYPKQAIPVLIEQAVQSIYREKQQ